MVMVMIEGGLVVGTEGAPHLALICSLMISSNNHDDDYGDGYFGNSLCLENKIILDGFQQDD